MTDKQKAPPALGARGAFVRGLKMPESSGSATITTESGRIVREVSGFRRCSREPSKRCALGASTFCKVIIRTSYFFAGGQIAKYAFVGHAENHS